MSEDLVEKLEKETGCNKVLGGLLLKFTGGDYNGALQIINSVEEEIYIFRGKFIAQSTKTYGSFLLLYNLRLHSYHLTEVLMLKEDKAAIEFDFTKSWREYHNDMSSFKRQYIVDNEKPSKFISLISASKNLQLLESKLKSKAESREDEIRNIFTDALINVIGDVSIALKLKIERTNIFELNRGIDDESEIYIDEKNKKTKEKPEENKDNHDLIFLKIEPEIAPVRGVALSDLKMNDLVLVRIVDQRPIANYISTLLNAIEPETEARLPVYAKLKDIDMADHGVYITVEFGPGIYGRAYFGEDVKITVNSLGDSLDDNLPEEKTKNFDDSFLTKYFWPVLGSLFFVVLVTFIVFYFFNS